MMMMMMGDLSYVWVDQGYISRYKYKFYRTARHCIGDGMAEVV